MASEEMDISANTQLETSEKAEPKVDSTTPEETTTNCYW